MAKQSNAQPVRIIGYQKHNGVTIAYEYSKEKQPLMTFADLNDYRQKLKRELNENEVYLMFRHE